MLVLVIFTIGAVFGVLVDGEAKLPDRDLKMVHVIYRHGTRTPADTYPNDPYLNITFEPFGWGALTNKGKQDMYEDGLFLRERYEEFLGPTYNPKEFYVQTTDSDRTKMSAQLMNAGIWPPKGFQIWGKLDWQPIPTVYEPLNQDSLLLVRTPCPKYHEELEKVEKEGEPKHLMEKNADLFKNLTEITGMEIKTFDDVQSLYSTLVAEEAFGLELPEWTKDYYPEKLEFLTEFSFLMNAWDDILKRLKGGVLLKKIMTDYYIKSGHDIHKRFASFYDFIHRERRKRDLPENSDYLQLLKDWLKEVHSETTVKRKMVLYAGHDSTVANLMSALKVWDPQVPGYGITILMEFSKDRHTGEYGIEIFLRNSTQVPPYKLTVPNCDSFCPLSKLVKLVEPVIPRNWEVECKSDDPNYIPPIIGGP